MEAAQGRGREVHSDVHDATDGSRTAVARSERWWRWRWRRRRQRALTSGLGKIPVVEWLVDRRGELTKDVDVVDELLERRRCAARVRIELRVALRVEDEL